MNDKIKKLQISLDAARKKLAIAKKENKTASITVLTMRISLLEKKIARLQSGEKTGAGKLLNKISKEGQKAGKKLKGEVQKIIKKPN